MTDIVKFALFVICMASWLAAGAAAGAGARAITEIVRDYSYARWTAEYNTITGMTTTANRLDQVQSESSQSKRCSRHINAKSVLQIGSGWGQYTVYGKQPSQPPAGRSCAIVFPSF